MKLFKSKKALSPVVAAIILIAVTVAVSIAVAAWMGALTFTFMKTEEVKVLSIDRTNWSNETATLTLKNSGTSELTIESVRVNDNSATLTPVGSATLAPGDQRNFTVDYTYVSGTKYEFAFYTASGNRYPYTSTAP